MSHKTMHKPKTRKVNTKTTRTRTSVKAKNMGAQHVKGGKTKGWLEVLDTGGGQSQDQLGSWGRHSPNNWKTSWLVGWLMEFNGARATDWPKSAKHKVQ
ncbi:hypothetical protein JGC18_24465 [Salmonella enterica subsp. enterica serovar Typhimurium]|nr:hypothetical protein [Salmonella enterica subsp. enterica serovar Typhimurium]